MLAFMKIIALLAWALFSVSPSPAAGHEAGVAPAQALKLLEEGNRRFVAGEPKECRGEEKARAALAASQSPHTIVLSCSDSRVPPELIFDQGLGRLFTVRVAGEVPDSSSMASIEYAVEHLGARLILVLGHDSCGAVKAALAPRSKDGDGSADLDYLVGAIRGHLKPEDASESDKTLAFPVKRNVDAVAAELSARSAILKQRLASGQVRVARGIYHLSSGRVEFW
jgi:carbonic anhydrase